MHIWQLQEAKAKLTELVNESKHAPQFISRRGINEAVVISVEKYREFTGQNEDIVSFFKHSPLYGLELNLDRDPSSIRETDL
jgi:antitoxin Phd